MGGVRPVVVGAVVVLLVGALVLLYVDRTDDGEPWEAVGTMDVAVAEDRRSILVLADSYRSGSCTEHRVTADRDGAEWTVRLEARTVGEWCTLEGCGWEGSTLADLIGPDGSVPGAGCPPVHALELDEPVPSGVTVVAAPAAG